MPTVQISGATGAPSPKILQAARVAAAGVSRETAVALADAFFGAGRRDDLAVLAAVTASRCAVVGAGCR